MKSRTDRDYLIGYIPVLHAGYLTAFAKYPTAKIGILGASILGEFDYLRKDIRLIKPNEMAKILRGFGREVEIIEQADLAKILRENSVAMLDDDISRNLAEKYADKYTTKNVLFEPVFLRWNRENIQKKEIVKADKTVKAEQLEFDIRELFAAAENSNDFWRHVAAAVIVDQKAELFYNRALPNQYANSVAGDPRILAQRGQDIDSSVFIHAEADLVANLARRGVATGGRAIYVTTFPCPTCAKLIASSGFKQCYFAEGYAVLDGYEILKAAGIEIIKIDAKPAKIRERSIALKYPEKVAKS